MCIYICFCSIYIYVIHFACLSNIMCSISFSIDHYLSYLLSIPAKENASEKTPQGLFSKAERQSEELLPSVPALR